LNQAYNQHKIVSKKGGEMKKKTINSFLLIGLIGTLTIGTNFAINLHRAFWAEESNWWTPRTMKLPIEETRNNFEIYIGEKFLQEHLSEGTLFSIDKNGEQYRIVSKDISVRLNNWDKMKASFLTNAIFSGFGFGASITLLIIGLIKVLTKKEDSS